MYRVAVILNESELLQSGYANVTPKLQSLDGLAHYEFQSFTVVNIANLFGTISDPLTRFDSIFITTNAMSDRAVLEAFRHNIDHLAKFLGLGKGLIICSQKKLSADATDFDDSVGTTQFLPPFYEYQTRLRPASEEDSGLGRISIAPEGKHHVVLHHPNVVTPEQVTHDCEHNEFRRHYYRSHIVAKHMGVYLPLLVDSAHPNENPRALLAVCQTPLKRERIVISTMALDWAFHRSLLTNTLRFATEGPPSVAFVKKAGSNDGDYDFLLTSAALSKISHMVYSDPGAIPVCLRQIHNTYIFSPGWDEATIVDFIDYASPAPEGRPVRREGYRRIYYFRRLDDALTLTQYSNFSTLDIVVDRAVLWLVGNFKGGFWGGSFWITHDILAMLFANQVNISAFVAPVLKEILGHYRNGSYDGVMGATCGLLELVTILRESNPSECDAAGFASAITAQICAWILDNSDSQSSSDKEMAFAALNSLRHSPGVTHILATGIAADRFLALSKAAQSTARMIDVTGVGCTEIDICRAIAVILAADPPDGEILKRLLKSLKERQSSLGEWTNMGRTAHVTVFLLKHWHMLCQTIPNSLELGDCDKMVYNAVLALRAGYNWDQGNWSGDLQATAKATHAIALYNHRHQYSTQDFLTSLEGDTRILQGTSLVRELSDALGALQVHIAQSEIVIASLIEENKKISRIVKHEPVLRHIAFLSSFVLTALVIELLASHPSMLSETVLAAGPLSIAGSVVCGLLAAWLMRKASERSSRISKTRRPDKTVASNE